MDLGRFPQCKLHLKPSQRTRHILQRGVRAAHLTFRNKGRPSRLALYMHAVERADVNALQECLTYLLQNEYRFVHVEDLLGSSSHVAHLSFDDNYRSWLNALPILDSLAVKATFYVNTAPLRDSASKAAVREYYDRIHHYGERIPLDSAELVAIRDAGHVIGTHSHSHVNLAAVSPAEARDEISRGKAVLEEILGEDIKHFSYPHGMRRHFNQELARYCDHLGIQTIATAIPGLQHRDHTAKAINRCLWRLDLPVPHNVQSLSIDGYWFERLTGFSPVG